MTHKRGSIAAYFAPAVKTPSAADGAKKARTSTDSSSRFERCPLCAKNVAKMLLESHVGTCIIRERREDGDSDAEVAEKQPATKPKPATNAFASMMAAQRERERERIFLLTYDAARSRWDVSLSLGKSIKAESSAKWASQVVVKEKLASGTTCSTTLKLMTDVASDDGPDQENALREALRDAKEYAEVRASRASADGEQLKFSVIKSALQKNIRRGRAAAASRVAMHMCLDPQALIECVRRLVIISLEDAILHPDVVLLTWLMCATSKGFEPTDALRAAVARIAGEMAAIRIKDSVSYGVAGDSASGVLALNDVEAALPAAEATVVQALMIRAHFGGMPGDVAMLHGFSHVWFNRFKQTAKSNDVPLEYDELRNPEIIDDKSPWLSYLELAFDAAREATDAAKTWGGFMRRDDIPIAAVDFHVSSCVEHVLQAPAVRLRIVEAGERFGFGDSIDVADRTKSAIWRHSAGVNKKSNIALRNTVVKTMIHPPTKKEQLSLAIWEIIREDYERWVRRYLAFRMPR